MDQGLIAAEERMRLQRIGVQDYIEGLSPATKEHNYMMGYRGAEAEYLAAQGCKHCFGEAIYTVDGIEEIYPCPWCQTGLDINGM